MLVLLGGLLQSDLISSGARGNQLGLRRGMQALERRSGGVHRRHGGLGDDVPSESALQVPQRRLRVLQGFLCLVRRQGTRHKAGHEGAQKDDT